MDFFREQKAVVIGVVIFLILIASWFAVDYFFLRDIRPGDDAPDEPREVGIGGPVDPGPAPSVDGIETTRWKSYVNYPFGVVLKYPPEYALAKYGEDKEKGSFETIMLRAASKPSVKITVYDYAGRMLQYDFPFGACGPTGGKTVINRLTMIKKIFALERRTEVAEGKTVVDYCLVSGRGNLIVVTHAGAEAGEDHTLEAGVLESVNILLRAIAGTYESI